MQSKPLIIAAWLIVGLAALPGAARACRVPAAQTPYLHETLPAIPEGAVAAEVEITTDVRSPVNVPLEARIISMRAGRYTGTKIRIEPQFVSSCDGFPYRGEQGFVVG